MTKDILYYTINGDRRCVKGLDTNKAHRYVNKIPGCYQVFCQVDLGFVLPATTVVTEAELRKQFKDWLR